MKVISIKTINPYFTLVWNDKKPFEIRFNDRDYQTGDILILREYGYIYGFSGKIIISEILEVIKFPDILRDNYVAFGINILERLSYGERG